jgi:polar amino acid transport system permease protein
MFDHIPILLKGAVTTIEITVLASILAFCIALLAGLGRLSRTRLIRAVCVGYIEFFRGTALLVQLFWLFFVLPQFGILLEPLTVAVVGIGLNYGAYGAEVVRGAILGVPRGQMEAASALNMPPLRTMWRIILPQAAIIMIPPWGNLIIQLLKATSLVSLITITEITFRAYQLNQLTVRTAEIFGAVLVIYFCLSQVISAGTRSLEHVFARGRAIGAPR